MKRPAGTVSRYTPGARANHWLNAIILILLALSGMALVPPGAVFPDRTVRRRCVDAHSAHPGWVSSSYSHSPGCSSASAAYNHLEQDRYPVGSTASATCCGARRNLPEVGRYNAGQKLVFWLHDDRISHAVPQRHRDVGVAVSAMSSSVGQKRRCRGGARHRWPGHMHRSSGSPTSTRRSGEGHRAAHDSARHQRLGLKFPPQSGCARRRPKVPQMKRAGAVRRTHRYRQRRTAPLRPPARSEKRSSGGPPPAHAVAMVIPDPDYLRFIPRASAPRRTSSPSARRHAAGREQIGFFP
jgi:hypothetical protein